MAPIPTASVQRIRGGRRVEPERGQLSASYGEGCPKAWGAALDHPDQVPSRDGGQEPTHTQDLPRVLSWGAPKRSLFGAAHWTNIQSWARDNGPNIRPRGLRADFLHQQHLSALVPFQSTLRYPASPHMGARTPSPLLGGRDKVLFSLTFPGPG